MSNEEAARNMRAEIIGCLKDISDPAKAERALDNAEEKRHVYWAIEALELAGAYGEYIDHHATDGTITKEEAEKLHYLDAQIAYLLKKHGSFDDIDKWLRDPRYAEVVRAARRALDIFKATQGDPPFK